MPDIPTKPSYSHGSTGTAPGSALDYANGDPVEATHFDYYLNTEFTKITAIIDFLNALDGDEDGKVDAAESADDATNVTSTYKGNDIDGNGDGKVNAADDADTVQQVDPRFDYFTNQQYGTVPSGDYVPVGYVQLDDGETLRITQATLLQNPFSDPAPEGLNLVLAAEGDTDTSGPTATILDGDGTTIYADREGTPLTSYSNTSGSPTRFIIAANNGDYGQTGVGADTNAYAGYIAHIV